MVRIELPWPPSVNHYWHRNGTRSYIGKKGVEFRQLAVILSAHAKSSFVNKERLAVTIYAYPPDRRKRDIDNLLKATLDSLQHAGIYEDDNQIDDLHIIRMAELENKMIVKISAR